MSTPNQAESEHVANLALATSEVLFKFSVELMWAIHYFEEELGDT
ncbi:hypothetical protein [Candidatus Poriferisocius sp.]